MHELWLCKSILDIIKQSVSKKNATRVKKVILEINEDPLLKRDGRTFH